LLLVARAKHTLLEVGRCQPIEKEGMPEVQRGKFSYSKVLLAMLDSL
jgi:hypothetical protein